MAETQQADVDYQWIPLNYEEKNAFNETYGFSGSQNRIHIEGILMRPRNRPSKTLFFFMHPSTPLHVLPVPQAMAKAGFHVLCTQNRYFRNDSALIFEKVLLDFGAFVRHAKEVLGYEKVVLVGWSGGGPLAVFYQSQAEAPNIVDTPAGDPINIVDAGLIPADAVIFQAASVSRARLMLEALDPSVKNELDPDDRDVNLDIYDPNNPNIRPYSKDYIEFFRSEQAKRMNRITTWVKETLETLRRRGTGEVERCFVTHRTMADPRFVDPTIDPNDRKPNWCLSGLPETVNSGPVGFGRFSNLRSWLSQWSIDDSRADATASAKRITVPFYAIENSADDGAPATHMPEVFDACASADKTYTLVKGANHYYANQPELMDQTVEGARKWLVERHLLDN